MTATLTATTPNDTAGKALPRLWATFSIRTGTAIQLAGTVGGAVLIGAAIVADSAPTGLRLALLLAGWLAAYLTSHAIAHVAVGRLVGIRFRAYGVRGTDHPENYPPGVRQLMSILPMWSALTDKTSMRQARPWAKAAMFAAGETSTTICSTILAAWAWLAGAPGGHTLFTLSVIWAVAASITVARIPKGDYTKALRAMHHNR